jgi:sec-independent protein translocase protein TatC
MTVVEHLAELRHRIIIVLVALLIAAIPAWFVYEPLVEVVRHPYCELLASDPGIAPVPGRCDLYFTGPVDAFLTKLKVVVFIALAIALPIVLYQLWAFIVPGLTDRERRWAIPFIIAATLLFLAGALFSYYTLPRALGFLLGFAGAGVKPLLTFDRYMGFITLVTLAFGLAFLFPILLIFLEAARIVSPQKLGEWRRWAILGIAIFSALITPSGDPYTMLAMMIPMYLFYEAAIIVGRLMRR